MRFVVVLLSMVVAPVVTGAAESDPGTSVRGYFAALDRQDFTGALALTDRQAQASTWHMVDDLRRQAAKNHARVEVKVRKLAVAATQTGDARGLAVPVQFHIDVVGHKWCFHKVARVLEGNARFIIDPQDRGRIIAIEGKLLE